MSKFGKIAHCNFQAYETEEISLYLERMSRQGFALRKIVGNLYLFHCNPDEKEKYRYAVILDERSFHAADLDAEIMRFLREYGYSDWEFVCRKPGMIICRKAGGSKAQPDAPHQPGIDADKLKQLRRKSVLSLELIFSIAAAIITCAASLIAIKIKFPSAGEFQQIIIRNFPFVIGTGVLIAFFVYYIGELYDYIVQNRRVSGNPANAGYRRTKLKGIMFQVGDIFGAVFILFGLIYGIYLGTFGTSAIDVIWILFVLVLCVLYLSPLNARIKGCHGYLLFITMYCYLISIWYVAYR